MKAIYTQIDQKIKDSKRIALITHKFPDGDTLGSATAFYEIIKTNFINKDVDIISRDGVAEKLSFLPNSGEIIKTFDYKKYDLCIFLDIGNIYLAGFGEKKELDCKFLINIDHHAVNVSYGDINLIDTVRPSTTVVLYDYFISMNYKINQNVATSLLTGVYTDTGAFMYSNVKSYTFEVASILQKLGGRTDLIVANFFLNNSLEFVKLLGLVLERLRINGEGVALSYLKKEDIINSGCKYEELDGIVCRLNMLDNIKYVCFLYEKSDIVKGSLRTSRENFDLNEIAKNYNGGGHKKACGFALEGVLEVDNNHVKVRCIDNNIINFF